MQEKTFKRTSTRVSVHEQEKGITVLREYKSIRLFKSREKRYQEKKNIKRGILSREQEYKRVHEYKSWV